VAFVPIFFLASSSSSPSSSSSTADGPEEDAGRPLMIGGDGDDVDGGGDAVRKQKGGAGGGIVVRPMWMSALELAFWNFGAQVREERRVGRAGCRRRPSYKRHDAIAMISPPAPFIVFFFLSPPQSCVISRIPDLTWMCPTQGLITAGLLSSPAARAAFLTQTSVVLTPLISAMAGERIASSVWGGCGIALFGLFLISTSGGTSAAAAAGAGAGAGAAAMMSLNRGDAMILLGALSWSAYIFRTSRLAGSYKELDLQFAKTALLAVMYGAWFALDARSALLGGAAGAGGWVGALTSLWPGWNASPLVWSLLAYSAVGPGAIADLLQQRGQRGTSASESNVILTMESVFAAACAYAFLGEVSSVREVAGGGLIVIAAILASR
jgi:drug/metabolite transporter (DMT)-like permease